jgi:hypothetical protein
VGSLNADYGYFEGCIQVSNEYCHAYAKWYAFWVLWNPKFVVLL